MKVLLTGYTGFLGRYIAKSLKQHGHWVRTVLHQHTVARMDFNAEADELLWGSLEDELLREKALAGVDAVIHSAWRFNSETATRPTANEVITEQLFKESLSTGIKIFVFISSVAVYGMGSDKNKLIDENSEYCSDADLFIYPSEKVKTEKALKNIEHNELRLGIFRPGPIFDENKKPFKIKIGNFAIGFGNGRNPMPLIHAADVAEAIMLWLTNGKNDDVYNITPSECLKQREWYIAWGNNKGLKLAPLFIPCWFLRITALGANALKKAFGKSGKTDVRYALAASTRSLKYSNALLTQELDWQPLHTDKIIKSSGFHSQILYSNESHQHL